MIPGQRRDSTVTVVGSGKVSSPDVGPKYRPVDHSAITDQPGSGWTEPTPLRSPDGINYVDALVFQQDVADLEARGRQEAAALGISLADWVKMQIEARKAAQEKAAKVKEGK
jgi:hypothetical protein